MMQLTLTATSEDRGARIDAWLAAHVEGLTRSAAAKLLESGGVAVNGASAAKNYRLTGGETVEVTRPEAEEIAVEPQDIPLDVVYEDQDVIVVNKPVGWWCILRRAIPTARWSTPCCITAAIRCPASAAKSGPVSSTASTGTPAA